MSNESFLIFEPIGSKTKFSQFSSNSHSISYHQKYYLQSHKELAKTLSLDEKLLRSSHVAARLNGYLVGVGGVQQYLDEVSSLGLNVSQKEYVRRFVEENEGGNLYC